MTTPRRITIPVLELTPSHWRRMLVVVTLIVVCWLLWIARDALIPFIVGAIIAYIISPAVERIARLQPWHRTNIELARGIGVVVVYAGMLAAIIIPSLFLVPIALEEVDQVIEDAPALVEAAQSQVNTWLERYRDQVPPEARERIDEIAASLGDDASNIAKGLVERTTNVAFSTLSALLGYIAVPFFIFYAVRDRHRGWTWFYRLFPPHLRDDVVECVQIVNRVFGAYLRAQAFLGFVIFVMTFIGLRLMGIEFALALAVVAGITELIPIIGPIIGFVPAFVIVLATEPDKWWWVILFYLAVQQAENNLLVPRVHSHSVDLHPVLVLLLITIGGALFGLGGVLLIVPVAAAAREVFRHVYNRLGEEEEKRLARAAAEKLSGSP